MDDLVIAERLGKRYGAYWAIRDLSLNIQRGEVFGMLGPNGAGKTTTMRLLACLLSPSEGRCTVSGYDITRNQTEIRKRIGFLTDTAGLYESLSAQENLSFYGKLYDVDPASARVRVEHYLKLLGLWERRRDPVATFSSGMKQKLSMARALLHEPDLLLLDEPTSALDPEGVKLVRDFIHTLKGEGRTIILCTHNLAEAQGLCDRVAIIKRTLLRSGTPRQLQTSLYGRQVEFRLSASAAAGSDATDGLMVTMNDLAVTVATVAGVGDVTVSRNSLYVSMDEPDMHTPQIVRLLVAHGMDVLRVAEVEHTLERAYLDLVARADQAALNGHTPPPPTPPAPPAQPQESRVNTAA